MSEKNLQRVSEPAENTKRKILLLKKLLQNNTFP